MATSPAPKPNILSSPMAQMKIILAASLDSVLLTATTPINRTLHGHVGTTIPAISTSATFWPSRDSLVEGRRTICGGKTKAAVSTSSMFRDTISYAFGGLGTYSVAHIRPLSNQQLWLSLPVTPFGTESCAQFPYHFHL